MSWGVREARKLLLFALIAMAFTACGEGSPSAWGGDTGKEEPLKALARQQLPTESPGSSPSPVPSPSPAPSSSPGSALTCPGRPPAPPLAASDLHGEWLWDNGVLYEPSGADYFASMVGELVLEPDGRWDGDRKVNDTLAYGPGDWTFDGQTLNLTYDDGSDTETFGAVRIGSHVEAESGIPYRALSLEIAYENGDCLIYLLIGPEVP